MEGAARGSGRLSFARFRARGTKALCRNGHALQRGLTGIAMLDGSRPVRSSKLETAFAV